MDSLISKYIEALKDGSEDVRERAANGLGAIRDKSATGPLINTLLGDKSLFVRSASAKALGQIRDCSAADALLAGLENEDVCEEAAEALGMLGEKRAVVPLIKALENGKMSVQKAAAEALGLIGDPNAIDALATTLMTKEEIVIKGWMHQPSSEHGAGIMEPKFKLKNENVRAAAARALGRIGDECAMGALIRALKEEGYMPYMPKISGLLKECASSVPKQDSRNDVRAAIFNALMRIIQSNRPFMDAHPNLFCRKCRRKSAKIEFKENPISQTFALAVCPACLNTTHLLTGITYITGVIGGNLDILNRKDKKISLPVWNEREKFAQYADIDALIVMADGVANYDLAVNAVILELISDTAANERLKSVPVYAENPQGLSASAAAMLKNTFKWIQ